MNIQSCLTPKLIRDNDGIQRYVPCGRCAACLKNRSFRWVQRLQQERYCWKYNIFFTLTYDNEHLPILQRHDNILVDVHHYCTPPDEEVLVLDIDEILYKYSKDKYRDNDWLTRIGIDVPCLSSYHLQKFIKRLRTYSQREYVKFRKSKETYKDKNDRVEFRYYCIGEYGETLLRPHYHGSLYTNSEFLASHASELIAKAWKFGRVDASLVGTENARYVASYLNCVTHLPSIYQYSKIRPFAIFSKCPPIGSLCHSSQEIQELFFRATPDLVIFDHGRGAFSNVPLWRTYIDRLYPRLSAFSTLSFADRVALYGLVENKKIGNFSHFLAFCASDLYSGERLTLIDDYVSYLRKNCNQFIAALQRWYYISSRVCRQASVFGISVKKYVSKICEFYENVEKSNLQNLYEFEVDYCEKNPPATLLGLDKLWLESLMDCNKQDLTAEELNILSSYDVDIDKFFSDDDEIRTTYQFSLIPENTLDFRQVSLDSEHWIERTAKTKRKNDYLAQHPEYKNILY